MPTPSDASSRPLALFLSLVVLLLLTALMVGLAPRRSAAQVELGGYYEHTLQTEFAQEEDELLIDASKIRLDLSSGMSGGLWFRGNVNFIVYHGAVQRDITPFLPPSAADALRLAGVPATFALPRERHYVDNAFLEWDAGTRRIRAGKQQLSWGPGYSFNPTDLFHRKNLLDPTYEKEGVSALRFDLRWGIGGELSAIMAPGDRLHEAGYALRLATHISAIGYDAALTAHAVTDSTALDPLTWAPLTQRRKALGLELSGSLLGLGVWLEGNHNWMESEGDFYRVLAGMDYTLPSGLYLMGEALYNGRAEEDTPYPVHDWLASVAYGEPVSRCWYMLGLRRDLGELTGGGLYLFAGPDGSGVVNPRLEVSIAQNADLVLFGGLTLGEEEGAFPPGLYSVVTRVTVWF